jgi:hypothetical protein
MYFSIPSFCDPPLQRLEHGQTRPRRHLVGDATLAPVQSPNGRWGYINEQQHWVIQPRFEDAQEFKGGRAAARQNGKWGFINKRGEWL